jgi:hypothetical protein
MNSSVTFGAALLGLVGVAALLLSGPRKGGSYSAFEKADTTAAEANDAASTKSTRSSGVPEVPIPPRPRTEEDYLRELELLNVTDKRTALAFAEAGERWYASTGAFAEARRVMRVNLLIELGRAQEAGQRARAFLAEFPESRHLARMRKVAGTNVETAP